MGCFSGLLRYSLCRLTRWGSSRSIPLADIVNCPKFLFALKPPLAKKSQGVKLGGLNAKGIANSEKARASGCPRASAHCAHYRRHPAVGEIGEFGKDRAQLRCSAQNTMPSAPGHKGWLGMTAASSG
jgi:hypothetical protein